LGVWYAAETGARHTVDLWLRTGLDQLGFSGPWLLPSAMIICLLAWHHLARQPWTCRAPILGGMYLESCCLAGVLVVLASGWMWHFATPVATSVAGGHPHWATLVTYLGAGIYEEVFFRLLLLSGVATICRAMGMGSLASGTVGVGLSSLLFALAHYQTLVPQGEILNAATFYFRLCAGLLFGALYWNRGFGIAVGTHAAYDLLVGLLR
jgi:membrane protease YdiL (CAAX protease family)